VHCTKSSTFTCKTPYGYVDKETSQLRLYPPTDVNTEPRLRVSYLHCQELIPQHWHRGTSVTKSLFSQTAGYIHVQCRMYTVKKQRHVTSADASFHSAPQQTRLGTKQPVGKAYCYYQPAGRGGKQTIDGRAEVGSL
jgi:hypothetical protein